MFHVLHKRSVMRQGTSCAPSSLGHNFVSLICYYHSLVFENLQYYCIMLRPFRRNGWKAVSLSQSLTWCKKLDIKNKKLWWTVNTLLFPQQILTSRYKCSAAPLWNLRFVLFKIVPVFAATIKFNLTYFRLLTMRKKNQQTLFLQCNWVTPFSWYCLPILTMWKFGISQVSR